MSRPNFRLDNPMLVRWEFASGERLANELGARVVALDSSERMVALTRDLTFSSRNGAAQVAPHFTQVEAREAEGVVVFPTPQAVRQFVAADMTRAHAAANVPDFDEPMRARSHHTVFVAEKAS